MKKSNLKRITIGVISFVLIAVMGFSYHDANAADSCTSINQADLDATFEKTDNKNQIVIKAGPVSGVKGTLNFTHIGEGNTSLIAKVNCPNASYEVKNNSEIEINIPNKNEICTIDYNNAETGFNIDAVLAIPQENLSGCTTICSKVTKKNNEDIYDICQNTQKDYIKNSPYLMHFEYEVGSKKIEKVHNDSRSAGGVCYKFINSDRDFFIKKLGLSEEEYNNYSPSKVGAGSYASSLPYCYASDQEYVDAEIDDSQLMATMKLAVKTKKFNSMSNSNKVIQINGNDFNLSNGRDAFEKYFIDNTKNGGKDKSLQCNAFILEQHDQGKTAEENYYVNNATYSAYSITTDSKQTDSYSYQCKKTCKETIKVSYGPPVGRLAGLCFEYKVKVKSIVDCSTTFTGEPPTMPKPTVCKYVPWCVKAHPSVAHQAGPSEEFDSCVIECDGGKYTDKCTKKCYKKVYSNSTRKLGLSYSNNIAKNMSNSVTQCKGEYADILNANLKKSCAGEIGRAGVVNNSECANAIRNIINLKGNYGKYKENGSSITWVPYAEYSDCNWAKYSPYYFSSWSEALRTALEDANYGPSNNTWIDGSIKYVPDQNGFKRRSIKSGGCNEKCHYEQSGTCNGTNQDYENKVEKYKKDLADYENAMSSCTAKVTCTEKTAEFTIKVNNKLKDQNKDNWIEYGVVGLTSNDKIVKKDISKTDFILDHNSEFGSSETEKGSTCYGDNVVNHKTYLTEWSFPGTWEQQKTGEITYEKPKDENAWKFKKEKFCTSLDSAEVNKVWWNYKDKLQSVTESEKTAILSDLEYNIFATARNFGYFGWNFDFKCFYSYSNSEPPEDCTEEDCPTPPEEGDEPTPDTYINRSINLDDNFPEEIASSLLNDPSKVGREQGYNWKLEASNVKNKDYEVLPSALTTAIQSRRQEIYDESKSDKYKDYEFILDKEKMRRIREYNKDLKYNYKKFGETSAEGITSKNGITCYRSSLIRSDKVKSTIDISKYNDELCVNNYNENESDETSVKSIANRNEYIQGLRALMQGGER